MKKTLLILSIIVFFSSCSIIRVVKLMNKGEVSCKEFYEQVPFEYENKMVIVPVTINGITYKFILDTGAPTVLSKDLADKLNCKPVSKVKSADAHKNKEQMEFIHAGDIYLDSLKFIKQGAAKYDFSLNKELSCFTFNSILGANLMKDAVWQIDIHNRIIRITNDIKKLGITEDAIKFKFSQQLTGTPVAEVTVDGVTVKNVTLDYGSGSGIDLVSEKLIKKIQDDKIKYIRVFGYNSMGLYGGNNDTTYLFQGDASVSGNSFGTNKITIRRKGISTIGTQIFKNYVVTFDWPNSTVYFQRTVPDPADESKTFGFTALLSDSKFIVTSITENSSANENGITMGDQILTVNDKDYTSFSSEDYCNYIVNGMVPQDVDEVNITFKHGDAVKNVHLERKKPDY